MFIIPREIALCQREYHRWVAVSLNFMPIACQRPLSLFLLALQAADLVGFGAICALI
jgi:hypothetical protein